MQDRSKDIRSALRGLKSKLGAVVFLIVGICAAATGVAVGQNGWPTRPIALWFLILPEVPPIRSRGP